MVGVVQVFRMLPAEEAVAYDAEKIAAATEACRGVVLTRGDDIRYPAVFLTDTVRAMVQQRYGSVDAVQRALFQAAIKTVGNWSMHKASLLRYHAVFATPTHAYQLLCDWSVLHELAQMSMTAYVLDLNDWLQRDLPAPACDDWQRRFAFFKQNVLGLASARFDNVVMKFDAADVDNELRHVITGHRVQAQLPQKLCRIFTSSTFDDLKVCVCELHTDRHTEHQCHSLCSSHWCLRTPVWCRATLATFRQRSNATYMRPV